MISSHGVQGDGGSQSLFILLLKFDGHYLASAVKTITTNMVTAMDLASFWLGREWWT
jgi:hypothetical protein